MTMSPAPTNFAEQVLREEADRIAKLKEKVMLEKVTEALKANEVREEKGKVNLKDEDNFPTLGKAKGILTSRINIYLLSIKFINSYHPSLD